MAVEEPGAYPGTLHAVLEVWTDSDWDLQYWTSIPGIPDRTGRAKIITNDLIEQRDSHLAISGKTLALTWIDVDKKTKEYRLLVTSKGLSHRDFARPQVVHRSKARLFEPLVSIEREGPRIRFFEDRPFRERQWGVLGGLLESPSIPRETFRPLVPAGAQYDALPPSGYYVWAKAGRVESATRDGTTVLARQRGCCPSIAGSLDRTWVSWLESQKRKGIYRVVRLRYAGPTGRFTDATTIPVTALSAK